MPRALKSLDYYPTEFLDYLDSMEEGIEFTLTLPTKKEAEFIRFRWYDFQKIYLTTCENWEEEMRMKAIAKHRVSKSYEALVRPVEALTADEILVSTAAELANRPHHLIFRSRAHSDFHKLVASATATAVYSEGTSDILARVQAGEVEPLSRADALKLLDKGEDYDDS